jgi:hypothetical protein
MAQEQLDLSVGALRAVRLSTREPNQVGERGLRLLIELARFRRRTQRSARACWTTPFRRLWPNLIRILANYSRSTTDTLLAIVQRIDDVNRTVNGVALRLDGKPGAYNLHIR